MYKIGDKIFYPMHGAGEIKAIEQKNILGKEETYYVISLPNQIKVMVPTDNADAIGIRPVVTKQEATNVISILETDITDGMENWAKRYNDNKDKLKTGDINAIADIYKNLSLRNREKNLSTGEKKMLINTKQVLISELSLATGNSFDDVEKRIELKIEENYAKLKSKKDDNA